MMYIQHRVNTIDQLLGIPSEYGVEIDLRASGSKICLQHEPFLIGENFVDWIRAYKGRTLILNVKEDGLEFKIERILKDAKIEEYFYLDQPFPTLLKSIHRGSRVAVRCSEYENLDSFGELDFQWVWIDSFSGTWDHLDSALTFAQARGAKTCLVSPELQGRNIDSVETRGLLNLTNFGLLDAICTKSPEWWKNAQI